MADQLTLEEKIEKLMSFVKEGETISVAINDADLGFELNVNSQEYAEINAELSKYDCTLRRMDAANQTFIQTLTKQSKTKYNNRQVAKSIESPVVTGWSQDGNAYIPPAFIKEVISFINLGELVYFVGPAGSGKTQCAQYIAESLHSQLGHKNPLKVHILNCPQANEKVLFGKDALRDGQTFFKEGILVKSARTGLDKDGNVIGEPSILVLDEFPGMNPMVGLMLNTVLADVRERREIVLPNEESFFAHPGWRIILTGNSRGRGQSSMNMTYTAQHDALDASTLDRIAATFIFNYSNEAELNMMKQAGIPASEINLLFNYLTTLRAARKDCHIQEDITTRTVKSICKAYRIFKSINKCIIYSVVNKCNEDSEGTYREAFKTVFGRDLT